MVFETDIVMHAMHSGDWMPHHVDAEWCKTQPFKNVDLIMKNGKIYENTINNALEN